MSLRVHYFHKCLTPNLKTHWTRLKKSENLSKRPILITLRLKMHNLWLSLPVCVLDYDGTLSQSIKETDSEAIQDIWRNATFVDYYESIACIEEVVFGKGVYIDSVARLNFLGR